MRSLPSISAPTWLWYQRDNTCSDVYDGDPKPDDGFRTSVCFSVQRVVAHEATHLTLLRPHYEDGLDGETIMQSNTPTPNGSPANWNRRAFLPCDAAAAELEYGAADPAGKLADCFKVTPGDGTKGLDPAMTLDTPAALTRCSNVATTVSGRLALADTAAYEDLRDMPLAGRVVRIDRRPANGTTWTTAVFTATAAEAAATNWSKAITTTSAGSYVYRATFWTNASETGINSSNSVTWTINWTTIGCPS